MIKELARREQSTVYIAEDRDGARVALGIDEPRPVCTHTVPVDDAPTAARRDDPGAPI